MPRFALPLLAGLVAMLTVPAAAMTFEPSPNGEIIRAHGPIEGGDAAKLKALLGEDGRYRFGLARQGVTLHLHSPGGSVLAGIELANLVRERGLMTHVGAQSGCYSACTFVFIGGVRRTVEGKFGIHAMSKGGGKQAIVVYSDTDLDAVQQLTSTLLNLAQTLIGDTRMISAMLTVPGAEIRLVPDNLLASWRVITNASRPAQRMQASFDCARGTLSPVETIICDHLQLADADRRMAAAYAWLEKSNVVADLKQEQERWAKYRDSCRHVPGPTSEFGPLNCVREAYDIRVGQLEGLKSFHEAAGRTPATGGWKEHAPVQDITTMQDRRP